MKSVVNKYSCPFALFVFGVILASCTGNAYQNAVPKDCVALAALEMESLSSLGGGDQRQMADIFHVDNIDHCGLDFSSPFYLFESRDGDFGFCAKVDDVDDLKNWLDKDLAKSGKCKKREERKGFTFAEWDGNWLIGCSDEAFLMMGPVLPAAMAQLQQKMVKYLSQDEEKGMKESRLTEVIDTMAAPVRVVARLSALPPVVTMPFAFGVPKTAGENDAYLKAEITKKDNRLVVEGATFSFKEKLNEEIQKTQKQLLLIGNKYLHTVPDSTLATAFAHVEGPSFLELIHTNKGLETVLTGANLAIDMDNIIRSMDGDIFIAYFPPKGKEKRFAMAAQLKNTDFLKDVDYWKTSCPKGTHIDNKGQNSFLFTGGEYELFFGVTDDNSMFFAATSEALAHSLLNSSSSSLSKETTELIKGRKLALCLNNKVLSGSSDETASLVLSMLNAFFGDTSQILFFLQ